MEMDGCSDKYSFFEDPEYDKSPSTSRCSNSGRLYSLDSHG